MKNIYSMTGYGAIQKTIASGEIACEIRTLNSRYLEIYPKVPLALKSYEDAIKNTLKDEIQRAKVNIIISFSETESLENALQVNTNVFRMYKNLLEEMRNEIGNAEPLRVSDFNQFKDLFIVKETEIDESQLGDVLELVKETAQKLNIARLAEGENLKADLFARLQIIEQFTSEVGEYAVENARLEFKKQMERLRNVIDENKLDRNRLEQEVALISDRVDITEEITRMQSHIGLFRENLETGSPIGKKLNFILQEMHREANTMSSKNTMIDISHRVVTIKEEIERMREQVQNIE